MKIDQSVFDFFQGPGAAENLSVTFVEDVQQIQHAILTFTWTSPSGGLSSTPTDIRMYQGGGGGGGWWYPPPPPLHPQFEHGVSLAPHFCRPGIATK